MTASKSFSASDVAKHNSAADCWIIVDGKVFDVTKFLADHPGGKKVLVGVAGTDATKKFNLFHKPATLTKYAPTLQVGVVGQSNDQSSNQPKPSPAQSKTEAPKPQSPKPQQSATQSPPKSSPSTDNKLSTVPSISKSEFSRYFGEQVPFGDPNWAQGWHSPYFKPHHDKFRAAVRDYVESELMPNVHEWDEKKQVPREQFIKMFEAGILPGVVGAPWPTAYVGDHIAGGLKPEQFDYFAESIITDEISRTGSGGIAWGFLGGLSIGLPPIMHFGSKYLQDKCVKPCLSGQKIICLAITEPYAGSDVANIQCEAKLSEDKKHYIVNGEKKWITNGVSADFFTVAVRTGGKGMGGISMLLIERGPGVTTKQMQCQGVWASGTTYITFEDVKVPVENLIGKENEGFKYIMYNFNHERWSMAIQATRFARVCLEEAMRYSFKRKTFGKLLIEHPVIRLKLAHMARQVESAQALLESITHQLNMMSYAEASKTLGGPIALLKAQSSIVFEYCAREASQIFGGLSYTRGGQGEKVERLYREVRAYAIPAGSEEIMLDLGIRQAIKPYQKKLASQ